MCLHTCLLLRNSTDRTANIAEVIAARSYHWYFTIKTTTGLLSTINCGQQHTTCLKS